MFNSTVYIIGIHYDFLQFKHMIMVLF